ncbi:MAG TPA: hypothetical protein VMM79_14695 [Longimicrobiales bacterium]|nr:hypothetical protein [Longimicrobiales bacterium]
MIEVRGADAEAAVLPGEHVGNGVIVEEPAPLEEAAGPRGGGVAFRTARRASDRHAAVHDRRGREARAGCDRFREYLSWMCP